MSILIPFVAQAFFSSDKWATRSETIQQTVSRELESGNAYRRMNKNQSPSGKITGVLMALLGIVVILISITMGFAGFDTGISWLSIAAFFVAAVGMLLGYVGISSLPDE